MVLSHGVRRSGWLARGAIALKFQEGFLHVF
jgi:hypothetical protein